MLKDSEVMAMVPVKDIEASKKFYSETLGLNKVDDQAFGVTYQCGPAKMFVYPTPKAGTAQSTAATWQVKDIAATVKDLTGKVQFEHYDYPGAEHQGDIHIMSGTRAAWFKDPDGNILGISQAG